MNQRDHKLIANVLRHAAERGDETARICEYFALVLRQENSRFNRDRFLDACGYVKANNRHHGSMLPLSNPAR